MNIVNISMCKSQGDSADSAACGGGTKRKDTEPALGKT